MSLESQFISLYESITIESKHHPIAWMPTASLEALAAHRARDWASTHRWNPKAESVGLAGELAAMKALGISPQTAMASFINGLNGADRGYDLSWGGETVDVKSSASSGARFKFSLSNPNRDAASVILFAQIIEREDLSQTAARLLGWGFSFRLKPLAKPKEGYAVLRFETAYQAGVMEPFEALKTISSQLSA